MKYFTLSLLIIHLPFLFFPDSSKAQSFTFPILIMNVQTIPVANDTSGGLPDLSDSTIFSATMNISLVDTTIIDQIYITLSDPDSSGNRLMHTFNWDVSGSTGNETSYFRDGYDITLGLGSFMNLLNYNASVSINEPRLVDCLPAGRQGNHTAQGKGF